MSRLESKLTAGAFVVTAEMPTIDAGGFPVRPSDGRPIDDLGRPIDAHGRPVGRDGQLLLAPDGIPLPRAPRSRMCEESVPRSFGVVCPLLQCSPFLFQLLSAMLQLSSKGCRLPCLAVDLSSKLL